MPVLAVSVEPSAVVPLIAGGVVTVGAAADETTAVGAHVACADPSALVAVTATRMVLPTSAVTSAYVCVVAPVIAEHVSPFWLQRLHAYV